ncbi:MAG: chromosomal replication initiator DnaA [Alphaproteobacteria bacterium]|nr:chromosomal replication initiator DnaA [Alphaproteobacteria bacterium]
MKPQPPAGLISPDAADVADAAFEVMSQAYNIPLARLSMTGRQHANVAFVRQTAMYLCHVVGQLTVRDIALIFGREPSTVSHACHAVEDRRDLEIFDQQLSLLEAALRARLAERRAERRADRDRLALPAPSTQADPGLEKKSARVLLRRLAG